MDIDIDSVILERIVQRQEELKEEQEEITKRLTELQSRFENNEGGLEEIMYLMD